MKTLTREEIAKAPKTDLHVHLDGSLRIGTLIELAKSGGVALPSETEEGLKELVFKEKYRDLPDYLQGFGLTCAVLQTPENLERAAYEMAQDEIAEGVRYLEARYAPQQHMRPGFSMEEVVASVARGLERAAKEHNGSAAVKEGRDLPFRYGILACAMRFFLRQFSPYYAELFDAMPYASNREVLAAGALELAKGAAALAEEKGLPIVGLDLAGAENGFPAKWFREAYEWAHDHLLHSTVHAGEAYGAESIFQAVTDCQAERIGHGTFIFAAEKVGEGVGDREAYVRRLVEYVGSRGITLEVCPTSNLQTLPELPDMGAHPLKKMVREGLKVSFSTDNRLVSRTSVTEETVRAMEGAGLTAAEVKRTALAGFEGGFFTNYKEKAELLAGARKAWDALVPEG